MEWVVFVFVMLLLAIVFYWLVGMAYGLVVHRPAVYFPFNLAFKMALASLFGLPLAGFGGVFLAVYVFHQSFSQRADYQQLTGLVAGVTIAVLVSGLLLMSAYFMAWEILG